MDLEICCICLESIIIPVEPICFPCRDDGQISCFSMKRICLVCFEKYLELQKHRMDRTIKKKCLFCPQCCQLHNHHKHKTFRVDYLLIDRNPKEIKCPYCGLIGSHLQIAKHIFSSCPDYFIECECGYTCNRNNMNQHHMSCLLYKQCNMCHEFVIDDELPRHMYYHHDQTRCFTCHQFINMDKLSNHIISECPERLITCEICASSIRSRLFKNHLRRHIIEINKNVQTIKHRLHEEETMYYNVHQLITTFNSVPDEEKN